LTFCQRLPVCPEQRTSSDPPGWSVSCQKAKYSLRADVSRCFPDNGHSSGDVENEALGSDDDGVPPHLGDRPGAADGQRLKLSVGAPDELLDDGAG